MDVNPDLPTNSLALSYEMEQKKFHQFRKVVETLTNTRLQNGNNEASPIQLECGEHDILIELKPCTVAPSNNDDNIINIQLPYDPNAPTEPEL